MVVNFNILYKYHIIIAKGEEYASLLAYKSAMKNHLSFKPCIYKNAKILLNKNYRNNYFTPLQPISIRSRYCINRKLYQSEEMGSTSQ